MPGYKGHLAGGATVALLTLLIFPQTIFTAFACFSCALAGSLFPDIDTKSKGQLLFYRIFLAAFILLLFLRQIHVLVLLSFLLFVPVLARHRGLFHRVWFLCFLSVGAFVYTGVCLEAYAYNVSISILFFLLGALSHVWLDIGLKGMIRWK